MNERYKFRGKRLDNGEWVEGSLIDGDRIVGEVVEWNEDYYCTEFWWTVEEQTIGQCTGLKDKNGKLIFEGDILFDGMQKWEVKYSAISQGMSAYEIGGNGIFSLYHLANKHNYKREIEIIGNNHDNLAS